jgi:probable F420-dependent oxidoreductase
MKVGIVFPTMEVGYDHGVLRDIAQAAEDFGYDNIMLEDHVLGADPTTGSYRDDGWVWGPVKNPGVTKDVSIHEPFVLLGFLAAVTRKVELGTSILVLPQRQTALVAKQAAEVDLLSGGRLRLGVGAGWNPVEFEGMGMSFEDRGEREEEQIEVLRLLWQHENLDYTGRWHRIDHAGINPLPGRQIPIWLGGAREVALRRAARLADGYMPLAVAPDDRGRALVERVRRYVAEAGRDPSTFGIEGFELASRPEGWRANYAAWRDMGATHLCLRVGHLDSTSPGRHIESMKTYMEAISTVEPAR